MIKLTKNQISLISTKLPIEEDKYIVLVDMTSNKQSSKDECNANIYCIDSHNNILWQVDSKLGTFDRDSFIYIEPTVNNNIIAKRFFGKKYLIDVRTGVSKEIGWEK